jgi:hypothetical protein
MNTLMITRGTTQAQLSDLEQGKWLYANVFDIDLCTSEAMRQGWRLAEVEFERSFYAMMGVDDMREVGEELERV